MTRAPARTLVVSACALLLATGARADSPEAARAGIRAALERWTAAFVERDARGACALFASDLVATYSGVPDRDYQAMCRQLTAALADPTRALRYSYQLEEILPIGDLAVVRLIWTLRVTGPGAGVAQTVRERGVDVFRRESDGTWKIIRSMAYEEAAR